MVRDRIPDQLLKSIFPRTLKSAPPSKEAYEILKRMILTGKLRKGQKLVQSTVASAEESAGMKLAAMKLAAMIGCPSWKTHRTPVFAPQGQGLFGRRGKEMPKTEVPHGAETVELAEDLLNAKDTNPEKTVRSSCPQ